MKTMSIEAMFILKGISNIKSIQTLENNNLIEEKKKATPKTNKYFREKLKTQPN